MSQPAALANLNIRVFTQSGPISDMGQQPRGPLGHSKWLPKGV
jgi:hypothetical protein